LNDEEFAQAWVENRNSFRPRSRRTLAMELRHKGLDDEVVREVLDQNVDENALALEAARKHLRKVEKLEWQDFRQKLGNFLGRRGFSYGVIAPVLRQVWDELHHVDDASAGSTHGQGMTPDGSQSIDDEDMI